MEAENMQVARQKVKPDVTALTGWYDTDWLHCNSAFAARERSAARVSGSL